MILNIMKDYHDLYLINNFVVLPCVSKAFRKKSMNSFHLDPAYYLSTPGYSWNAMLTFADVNLKLMSDIKKHNCKFVESPTGGIFMICKGYAEANNNFSQLKYWIGLNQKILI